MKKFIPVLFFTAAFPALAVVPGHTKGRELAPFAPEFKRGDYVWKPQVSPAGPVLIIVSIPEQKMTVFRNGVRIGSTTVSTGKAGKATPTGVFTILQKKIDHESSIYKGAKMPHMQRLTWSGIAMHAGNLPGYPASAGCVRLPTDFAAKLYSVTNVGTTVIVTDNKSAPSHTTNASALLTGRPGAPLANGRFEWEPAKAPSGALSIIFSTADRQSYVYRNGALIGRAGFTLDGQVNGSHVYSALAPVDSAGRRDWLSTTSIGQSKAPDIKALSAHLSIAPEFLTHLRSVIVPGSTLIVTDMPVSRQTHSSSGYGILTTSR
jgi:L,D-transpeptidase catalytic domain